MASVSATCRRIADNGRFQGFIMLVIVANAVTLGLGTYDVSETFDDVLTVLDEAFLGIFVVELVIRIASSITKIPTQTSLTSRSSDPASASMPS